MEDMAERDTEPGAGKPSRRVVGKLLVLVAGMGAVALVVFVGQPMLTAPAPEPPPLAPEEIVAEVLSEPPAEEAVGPTLAEVVEREKPASMPTPLMAVRHGGEEVPVVFPAAEEPVAGEDAGPADSLPPLLSPEEIEEAVSIPVPVDDTLAEGAPQADKSEEVGPQAPAPAAQGSVDAGSMRDGAFQGRDGGTPAPTTLPPAEATREVQELLESLGYAPGPADGIWGERTDRAWKNFARDASPVNAGTGLDQVPLPTPDAAGAPTQPEEPAAPSGGTGVEAVHGPRQAGAPQVGLPVPDSGRQGERTRVPGTLRGVMGYRLPLVSRQEVPDQIVSGVLIPAHTTFVILRGGEWELTGLDPDEVERLKGERAGRQPESLAPKTRPEPQRRGWNPLRLFRRQPPSVHGK